jgi:hypothetical protein
VPVVQEFDIQRAFTIFYKGEQWAAGPLKGTWKVRPAARPGVVAWHTPNGGSRSKLEGMRFKQIGVEAGLHDYFFLWGGLYGLEFKTPGGSLSSSQIQMHPRLMAAGMIASAVVDNLADAKAFVIRHGLTVDI